MCVRENAGLLCGDLGDDRPDIVQCESEPLEPRGVEPAEDANHEVVTQDLDVRQDLATAVADPDQDHAAILRMSDALDEAVLLHPIDEPSRIRVRHAEKLGDPAHRQLAVAIEHRHQVEMAHRDAVPDEPLAAHAAQLAQRRAKLGDDSVDERRAVRLELISS